MSFTFNSNIGYRQTGVNYRGIGQFGLRSTASPRFTARIEQPNIRKVFLLTLTITQWLKGARKINPADPLAAQRQFAVQIPYPLGALPSGVFRNNAGNSLTQANTHLDIYSQSPMEFLTAGTWGYRERDIHDGKSYIYVNPADGDFFGHVWHVVLKFYLANMPKLLRGVFWEPRLQSVPTLSMRIESRWGGVGQIGGGTVQLANADKFFSAFDEEHFQWDGGLAILEMGLDLPAAGAEMAESDYVKIGTWRVETTEKDGESFTVRLRELKTRIENKIPYETFTREAYPAIANDVVGKPIPYAWGRLFGIKPVLIDALARRFKVASHPIRTFDGVRARINGIWTDVNFASFDLEKAEFTLGAEWTGTEDVSVDFSGRRKADGTLMQNGADVVADLLNYVGETIFDAASFEAARVILRIGQDRYGEEVCLLAPALYLDTERSALDVVSELAVILGGHLYIDFTGRWRFGVWDAIPGKQLDPFPGNLIKKFSDKDVVDGSYFKTVDTSRVYSSIKVNYARRRQENWTESVTAERPRNEYVHGLSSLFTQTKEIGLSNGSDAQYWAERALVTDAEQLTLHNFTVPWNGFYLLPGEPVHLIYPREKLDGILEVLQVNYDLIAGRVKVIAGNQRGWADSFGFWVGESQVTVPQTALWLKPEELAASYLQGQAISLWSDSSGNNRHATQSIVAKQPTYQPSLINGFGVCRFTTDALDQVRQWLALPDLSALSSGGIGTEIFVVTMIRRFTGGTGNALWTFGSNTALEQFPDTEGIIQEQFGLTVALTTSNPNLTGWLLYNVSSKDLEFFIRLNNAQLFTSLFTSYAMSATPYLGRHGTTDANNFFDGDIAELMMFDRVLTTAERANVVQYLSDKFALALVPAGAAVPPWDKNWTDAQAAENRQNAGFWAGTQASTGAETDMAHEEDPRSHFPGRWM